MKNNQKLLRILCHQFLFVYIYKMYLISTEGYKKADVKHIVVQKLVKFGQE